ncbi:MAG: FG-GAP-like repeat-containing protein [Acidobacteriota bacterium]
MIVIPSSSRPQASGGAIEAGCSTVSFAGVGSPFDAGELPVDLTVADFNGDNRPDLAIANVRSNDVTILLRKASGDLYQPPDSPIEAGDEPISIASGDFNSDTRTDLAVANQRSGDLTVFLGDGAGGFSQSPGSPLAGRPSSVRTGDFNLDGKLDLVVTTVITNPSLVRILLGDGMGGFAEAAGSPYAIAQSPINSVVAVKDLNNDGKPDLAVTSSASNSDVSIFLGNGAGGFTRAADAQIPTGSTPTSVAAADFNGDDRIDLAVSIFTNASASGPTSSSLAIFFGNGTGGFSQSGQTPLPVSGLHSMAVADFDLDAYADLAVTSFTTSNATVLLNNKSGAFTPTPSGPLSSGGSPVAVAAEDFNGDGKPDFAMVNLVSDNVTEYRGDGAGRFAETGSSPVQERPVEVAVIDFNLDNLPDLATAAPGSGVVVLTGKGDGLFEKAPGSPFATGGGSGAIATGDFNRDNRPDLAVASPGGVSILLRDATDGFAQPGGSPLSAGGDPVDLAVADFNRDGLLDFAAATGAGSSNVSVMLGNGAGGFAHAPGSPLTGGASPRAIAAADFNRDGRLDLAVASQISNSVSILIGNGAGGFTPSATPFGTIGQVPDELAVADFNRDSISDLAVVNLITSSLTVMLGNGAGGFNATMDSPIATGPAPTSLAAGDFNLDGIADLAVVTANDDRVRVLLGEGNGSFDATTVPPAPTGSLPFSIAVADFNLDGKPDFATANFSSNDVRVRLSSCSAPPMIICPSPIRVSHDAGRCGAVVFFDVETVGVPAPSLTCLPPSGNLFPVGVTTVSCAASNGIAPDALCSFTVTITDDEFPTVTTPLSIITAAESGRCSALVTFTASASDTCSGVIATSCDPASGSYFPVGATTVTCAATDAAGNTASRSFTVTVTDTQAPVITCPQPIAKPNDAGLCSSVVNFTATAIDNCDGPLAPLCNPASGSAFPAGVTTVNCLAKDAADNSASCSFTVTISDTQAPVIACPSNLIAQLGAVSYAAPTASDNCASAPVVVCSPPSGSIFPAGVTTVSCTATDAAANRASCSFTVTTLDICIESGGSRFGFSSVTGDYILCCGGVTLAGKGAVSIKGNLVNLRHDVADRRVTAQVDRGKGTGTATAQWPLGVTACSIIDRDIKVGVCACQ